MKAFILKEFRELSLSASMILIAIAADLGIELYLQISKHSADTGLNFVVSTISFCGAGFAIGLIQMIRDYPAGRWAFVTHRPISRTRIFLAKIVAGTVVYVLVVLIPLSGMIWWVTYPGHVAAPFDWHMLLPRLTNVMDGLIWYSAALLLISRRARWVGSRIFPVGIAFLATIASMFLVLNFGMSLLVCAVSIVFLALPAGSAFVYGGIYHRQPIWIRYLQALAILPGLAMAMGLGTGLVIQASELLNGRQNSDNYSVSSYGVTSEGEIFVGTYATTSRTFKDLHGNVLHLDEQKQPRMEMIWLRRNPETMTYDEKLNMNGYFSATRYRRGLPNVDPQAIEWFYVADRRTIVGYGPNARYVGSIEPDGFRSADQAAQPFPEPLDLGFYSTGLDSLMVVAGSRSVYAIDYQSRTIRRMYVPAPGDSIQDVSSFVRDSGPKAVSWTAITTGSAIHVMERNQETATIPLSHSVETSTWPYIYFARLADGKFFLVYQGATNDWIVATDPSGKIVSEIAVPTLEPVPTMPSGSGWEGWLVALVSPPAFGIIGTLYHETIPRGAYIAWIIAAFVGGGITWMIFGRYDARRGPRIFWTTMNVFLGLGGVLLLLCLRDGYSRTRCPACGKRRLVTLELCEHCGKPFEPPAAKGIEIFESAGALQTASS